MIRAYPDLMTMLRQRRELIGELINREISERYAGAMLGRAWAFGHPLIAMAVYLFVFNFIFRSAGAGQFPSIYDYATFLLAGLLPWMVTAEVLNKSSSILFSHASLVKQIVFPIEVLPLKATLVTLITQLIGLGGTLVYMLTSAGQLQPILALLPIVVALHFLFNLGLAYGIAALTLFLRDLKDLITVFCNLGLYITPTLFFAGQYPHLFGLIIELNPFSHMVFVYQDLLYYGDVVHPLSWVLFTTMSLVMFPLGYLTFQKLRPAFGDLL